jgi:hypothetical protein
MPSATRQRAARGPGPLGTATSTSSRTRAATSAPSSREAIAVAVLRSAKRIRSLWHLQFLLHDRRHVHRHWPCDRRCLGRLFHGRRRVRGSARQRQRLGVLQPDSHVTDGRCVVAHFVDGLIVNPFPGVPCPRSAWVQGRAAARRPRARSGSRNTQFGPPFVRNSNRGA